VDEHVCKGILEFFSFFVWQDTRKAFRWL